ncbi:unnamed protein product [Prunus armeniaca]|nr:hypothetical protein GBA52_015447 [Prunus armeniaca]
MKYLITFGALLSRCPWHHCMKLLLTESEWPLGRNTNGGEAALPVFLMWSYVVWGCSPIL